MLSVPSYAKISELQLRIVSPDDAARNVMNLKLQAAAAFRECWAGQVAFAAMHPNDANKFLSWVEQFEGRLTAFGVPVYEGHFTKTPSHTGTLAADTTAGSSTLSLTVSPVSGTIEAGTLLTVGNADNDEYQVFEVLADAAVSSNPVSVEVSPRVRWVFSSGATVTFGATNMRFRLREDYVGDHSIDISHGVVVLDVVEGVYA